MQQRDWDRVQELFLSAADLAADERQRFLDKSCSPELREEVESLLAADCKRGEGITTAVEKGAAAILDARALVGERLGAYRVLRQIGRGGMGAVYLATRDDDQYRKEVAIKVVKRGMDTEEVLARFRYERQILANLDHPYIASLHDSGTTADGRPFFVMEYVQGQAVDEYCKQTSLDIQERCRLFLKICEAVAHAHRNLVIHRDLKPANIFVTPQGIPKLLDFGIAKLLDESAGAGHTTIASSRPITPEYASPEQIRGYPVTTATDIYSLGVVLYELLTGKRAHRIENTTPQEIQRAVCETEVVRASEIAPDLDSDLDNIIVMAMRKEPERRYISVDQFAGDIRCYLESRPVLARRDSVSYRVRKFAARHRYALGAGVTILAGIISLSAIALYQAHQARAARRTAELNLDTAVVERQRAEERLAQMVDLSNHSLSNVYAAMERLPGAMPARKELVNTTLEFLEKLSKDAGTDQNLKLALARAYSRLGDLQGDPDSANIGDTTGALKSYRTASALLGSAPPIHDTERLVAWTEIQNRIGKVLTVMGSRSGASELFENAIRVCEANRDAICGPATLLRATLYLSLSRATLDLPLALERAREALRSATAAAQAAPHDANTQALLSTANTQFGFVYTLLGEPDLAEAPYERSVRIREELAREHPNDIFFRRLLKLAYEHLASLEGNADRLNLGRPDLARIYYEKARPLEEADAADSQNLLAKFDYGLYLLAAANVDVPKQELGRSVANLRRAAGIFESLATTEPLHNYRRSLALAHSAIGRRFRQMERYSDAIREYRLARSLQSELLAQEPDLATIQREFLESERGIALTWMSAGDETAAFDQIRHALQTAESLRGTEEPIQVAETHLAFAAIHKYFGQCADAKASAAHAVEQVRPLLTTAKRDRYRDLVQRAEALIDECDSPR